MYDRFQPGDIVQYKGDFNFFECEVVPDIEGRYIRQNYNKCWQLHITLPGWPQWVFVSRCVNLTR